MQRNAMPAPRGSAIRSLATIALALCCVPTALEACGSTVNEVGEVSSTTGGGGGKSSSTGTGAEPVTCAGKVCAAGEACCMTTTQCYNPAAAPNACAPPDLPPNNQGQKACSSSTQCAADEFCNPANDALCLGPGYCTPKTNCGTSSGSSVCGCDGVTYPDVQTACLHGVHVIGLGACGDAQGAGGGSATKQVVYCASDDVCPSGDACCYITGKCYDTSKPALCAFPPPGTTYPCIENADCPGTSYCNAEGCDGPGGCVNVPVGCPGTLSPVCGCDGETYVNAECAAAGATRVAHDGECSP